MKRNLLVIVLAMLLTQCSGGNEKDAQTNAGLDTETGPAKRMGIRSISPFDAKQLLSSNRHIILLDVRTPEEQKLYGTIDGAHLVPFWAIMQNKLNISPEQPILLFCAVGGRSYWAGQTLVRNGYQEVYNLKGGIDGWKRAGLPVK